MMSAVQTVIGVGPSEGMGLAMAKEQLDARAAAGGSWNRGESGSE